MTALFPKALCQSLSFPPPMALPAQGATTTPVPQPRSSYGAQQDGAMGHGRAGPAGGCVGNNAGRVGGEHGAAALSTAGGDSRGNGGSRDDGARQQLPEDRFHVVL